jgi:hypothetical protein
MGYEVFTGTIISGDRAFAEVLAGEDRLNCFGQVMSNGTNEARMYALAALRELSPADYKIALKRLQAQRFAVIRVATVQQGVLLTESSEAVIKHIDKGLFRREVHFWLNQKVSRGGTWKEQASKQMETLKARLRQSSEGLR